MDLKKEAAREAYRLIKNNSSVGLGDGTAIRSLAEFIIEGLKEGLTLRLYTSSLRTQNFLQESGITVKDFSAIDELDQYFDGCDQVDGQLNAFKSGAGIHTTEKILASMARKFYLLADASKFVDRLENKYPLVLEILPPATSFVLRELKSHYPDASFSIRVSDGTNSPAITRYGNYLLECRFPVLPELASLQTHCKNITGVVEISLFYGIASGAIIAGQEGVKRFERKNGRITVADQYPY